MSDRKITALKKFSICIKTLVIVISGTSYVPGYKYRHIAHLWVGVSDEFLPNNKSFGDLL